MAEHKMPPMACPHCSYVMDCATEVSGEGRPQADHFTLCIKCGTILRFNADFSLRLAGDADMAELSEDQKTMLRRAQYMVRTRLNTTWRPLNADGSQLAGALRDKFVEIVPGMPGVQFINMR